MKLEDKCNISFNFTCYYIQPHIWREITKKCTCNLFTCTVEEMSYYTILLLLTTIYFNNKENPTWINTQPWVILLWQIFFFSMCEIPVHVYTIYVLLFNCIYTVYLYKHKIMIHGPWLFTKIPISFLTWMWNNWKMNKKSINKLSLHTHIHRCYHKCPDLLLAKLQTLQKYYLVMIVDHEEMVYICYIQITIQIFKLFLPTSSPMIKMY